jgi:hypothetical protein
MSIEKPPARILAELHSYLAEEEAEHLPSSQRRIENKVSV